MNPDKDPLAGRFYRRERIANVLDDPAIWRAGEELFPPPSQDGGAPRKYPGWMLVAYNSLISEFGTAQSVELELRDPEIWRQLQEAGRCRYPADPAMWLRNEPIRRHHYAYAKAKYLRTPDGLPLYGEVARGDAAVIATEVGLCVEAPGASWTHPPLENVVYGDGKVVKARTRKPYLDRDTGEIRPRCEPDAETYTTGAGEVVTGVGFVLLATRAVDPNVRVILDVIDAPGAGGEMAHAMKAFERVRPLLPGSMVELYDGAQRGKHKKESLKAGKLPVGPARNKDNPTPKEFPYGAVEVRSADGTTRVLQIQLVDGAPHIKELADDGSPIYTRLERIKTTKPKAGSGRTYNEYAIPDDMGGGILRLRLNSDQQDRDRGFNREEHLFAIPPGDPDYQRIYGRRNDSESGNNTLDNALWRERAHSIGRPGILVDLIGWMIYNNAQARALGRQRARPAASSAA